MIRRFIEELGGRRYVLAIGAGIVATVLQWFGKLDAAGTTYAVIVIGCVGAYITGNTVQKVKQPGDSA